MISPKLTKNLISISIILIILMWWKLGIFKSNTDYLLVFILSISSIITLFFKKNYLLDLAHFLYCFLYFILVIIFSNNKYLLLLNTLMLFVIICTRYYYGKCILNREERGRFEDLNKNLKLDWNIIFPMELILSAGKTVVLFEKK